MNIYDSKKDYLENWVLLHFDGEYDEQTAFEYVSKNYSGVIRKSSEVSLPYDTPYGRQLGSVHYKCR